MHRLFYFQESQRLGYSRTSFDELIHTSGVILARFEGRGA